MRLKTKLRHLPYRPFPVRSRYTPKSARRFRKYINAQNRRAGRALADLRRAHGISHQELAAWTVSPKLTQQDIHRVETGVGTTLDYEVYDGFLAAYIDMSPAGRAWVRR
ncbi:hypothetical protein NQ036_03790 [Brevibacterium sp. 91QC2O2]|uniref:hypothetical protein n=1 Tax=Brevibacterium TaxID=1696 RepID=UPI00211CD000|nr:MULTISPECIES: hypothetical protein [unclassified Brevibacterium]MCQ9367369.1 hypothetical protein [Brevibacterium sp. 91QC2O2]MCQ9384618.1 hypothetical protein [Brevibacterium sp. 68QC2CO]